MVTPHLAALLLFSFLVSVVFGVVAKDTRRERMLYGIRSFLLFVGISILLGWLMYPVPWR